MAIVVDINHEGGNLNEWTSISNAADLAVNSGAALAGTNYGLQVTVDDNTARYGQYSLTEDNTTGIVRLRFYVDPNTLGNDGSDSANIVQPSNSTGAGFGYVVLHYSSSSYGIRLSIVNDTPTNVTTAIYPITDAPHYVEALWVKASTADANDGYASLWIDGVFKETLSNVDSFTRWGSGFRLVRFGFTYSTAAFNGTFFMDELVVRDDNTEIGPVATLGIIDIGHERANLTEYTTTVTGSSNSLVSSSLAALGTTNHGLSVTINDINPVYGEYKLGTTYSSPTHLRYRLYFDPNTLNIGDGEYFRFFEGYNSLSGSVFAIDLGRSDALGYFLKSYAAQEGGDGLLLLDTDAITDEQHRLEFYQNRSTGSATAFFYVDGTAVAIASSINNWNQYFDFDRIRVGAISGIDSGTSGTFYVDEIIVRSENVTIDTVMLFGSVCWGHSTGVIEQNIKSFDINWYGTGIIENTGDGERIALTSGQYMISNTIYTGIKTIMLSKDIYSPVTGSSVTLQYRTALTEELLKNSASFDDYFVPFESSGYVQLKLIVT